MAASNSFINRDNLGGLFPEDIIREIMQGAIENSAVLRVGRRLPNMSTKTQSINVLDMLPTAYWVDGDDGFKQTSAMAWQRKRLYAEELAVIIPIPEAVLDDSNYDIWGEVRPRLVEAMGKRIDEAILFNKNKPSTWRNGIVADATTAGNVVIAGTGESADLYQELLGEGGLIAKVEEDGYYPSNLLADISMRAKLRGLVDANKQPIFLTTMQQSANYALDGTPLDFPMNGSWDNTEALMVAGDFRELVYSIRQDVTYKILTEATIVDPQTKAVVYSLAQQDMIALRAVMRLGWEIPNPASAYRAGVTNPFPFAVYVSGAEGATGATGATGNG